MQSKVLEIITGRFQGRTTAESDEKKAHDRLWGSCLASSLRSDGVLQHRVGQWSYISMSTDQIYGFSAERSKEEQYQRTSVL